MAYRKQYRRPLRPTVGDTVGSTILMSVRCPINGPRAAQAKSLNSDPEQTNPEALNPDPNL